jgi:surfeit locus 1 family protein
MKRNPLPRLRFRLNWKVTLFSVVSCAGFVYLGLWQMDRAVEKTRLIAAAAQHAAMAAEPLSQLTNDRAAVDTHVKASGDYQQGISFLLDNRVLDGQVGFDVLVPFQDQSDGRLVLVNRGFVPMGRTRDDPPAIPGLQPNPQSLTGHVYVATRRHDEERMLKSVGAAGIILQLEDPLLVAADLGAEIYSHVVRLDESDPNALPRNWVVTVMLPARHTGYAIQWFLMALAVTVAWVVFSFEIKSAHHE